MATVYQIPTDNYDLIINFKVVMDKPVILRLRGYDAHPMHPNSVYFDRTFGAPGALVKGVKQIQAPLPISPEKINIIAYDEITGSQTGIRIEDVKVGPLDKKIVAFKTPEDYEFFKFLEDFVKRCGFSPSGKYTSPSGKFKILLSDKLYNKEGKQLTTPARIFYPGGEMEFSKPKYDKMTIPIRMFIGLHERCHFRLGHGNENIKRDEATLKKMEGQADSYAMSIYLGMGYPKSEAIYAFTKVFTPVNERHAQDLVKRMDQAVSFVKQF